MMMMLTMLIMMMLIILCLTDAISGTHLTTSDFKLYTFLRRLEFLQVYWLFLHNYIFINDNYDNKLSNHNNDDDLEDAVHDDGNKYCF